LSPLIGGYAHQYPSLQGNNQGNYNFPKAIDCWLASPEANVA